MYHCGILKEPYPKPTAQVEKFAVYPDILEAAGYAVGYSRKGWGPGSLEGVNGQGGRPRNPAGPEFKSFGEFYRMAPKDKPFCFWFGSQDPHRPYDQGAGLKSGMKLEDVIVPPMPRSNESCARRWTSG